MKTLGREVALHAYTGILFSLKYDSQDLGSTCSKDREMPTEPSRLVHASCTGCLLVDGPHPRSI